MGLGFFIAKTLLERTGAKVSFRNGRRGGAVVCVCWDRADIEVAPEAMVLKREAPVSVLS
jgi:two-component system sensor histidine kinase RegB